MVINPSVDGHWNCFQLLALCEYAGMRYLFQALLSFLWGIHLEVTSLGHKVILRLIAEIARRSSTVVCHSAYGHFYVVKLCESILCYRKLILGYSEPIQKVHLC